MKTLTEENVESFGTDVQNILSTHSSAMKLMSLPGSRGPVWPALSCLLAEGVRRKDGAEKTIVVALRKLAGVLSVDVCQLLQPVVEEMAIDLCEVGGCRLILSLTHYPSVPPLSSNHLPLSSQYGASACFAASWASCFSMPATLGTEIMQQ
jgi:hypothetical protein